MGVGVTGLGLALVRLERVAAAAGRLDVRVLDLEARLLERVDEVDRRALQVRRAERVDDDGDAVEVVRLVALLDAGVEPERVLETGAPTALDRDAQDRGLALGL